MNTSTKYVYLASPLPENSDVELNDVGTVEGHDQNLSTLTVKFLRIGQTIDVSPERVEAFDIHETGDRFEYKICDRCFKRLDSTQSFSNNRHKKDNVITKRPSCKACRKLKDGKPIPAAEKAKWAGTRPDKFSDFTCPICEKTTIVGITKVVLDHNHDTGAVRGWLCESCNTGIGRFDDKPEIVKRAISWLETN